VFYILLLQCDYIATSRIPNGDDVVATLREKGGYRVMKCESKRFATDTFAVEAWRGVRRVTSLAWRQSDKVAGFLPLPTNAAKWTHDNLPVCQSYRSQDKRYPNKLLVDHSCIELTVPWNRIPFSLRNGLQR
jgi:hypothetical protein